ncbi:MAG: hypothetical protein Q9212_000130 [Teloschistes hypoglaucus]
MRVLGLSLVTNIAVQVPVLRGDDASVMDMNQGELARAIAEGTASHEEVLKAGEEAALDLQTLIHDLMMTIMNEETGPATKE